MKYKLYAISDPNHLYYKEIRGIRYSDQYHFLPFNATYINKEYDTEKDGDIGRDLFFKDESSRQDINFAKYRVNDDYTGIVQISLPELKENPRYKKHKGEEEVKKLMDKKLKKAIRQQKRDILQALRVSNPELDEHITTHKNILDAEDASDNENDN